MAKKRKPESESESDSSSSSGSSGEYELIEEEVELTDSDSDSSSSSESESEPESEKKNEKSSDGADDDESTDSTGREAIRRLVEPFSKEQLMELLAEAAMRNPEVLSSIASSAQSDPEHRKIFVHGLSYDAKTEDLETAFSQFGPIQEVKAVCDKNTGRCKGYGFVLFQNRIDAQKALKDPQKRIGDRAVSCQLASRGPQQKPRQQANVGTDVQPAGNLGFLGAFNHLAGLGLLNQTGTPHAGAVPSNLLGGLGLLNQIGTGQSNSLAGLGLLNRTGLPGSSNPLAGLDLLNQTGAGKRNFQFQR